MSFINSNDLNRKRPIINGIEQRIEPAKYLSILFDDLKYDRLHRNDFLTSRLGRTIRFLDELSEKEMSSMINELRKQKYKL